MKALLQKILALSAKAIIKKYKPIIIGVTGSVGKTSAKEAIFLLVKEKYKARRAKGNLNNELGLPLAIIGMHSPGKNVFGWLAVILKALGLIIFVRNYPELIVLEYGIDRKGDMDYLLSIAKPHISVITSIGVSHLEFLKDEATIEREKARIVEVLEASDFAVLNADNVKASAQARKTKAKVVTYGISSGDVTAKNIQENFTLPVSTNFSLILPTGQGGDVTLPVLGAPHLSSILCAFAVASILEIEVTTTAKAVELYKPVPGRLSVLAGVKKSILIDDTYNSAPDSAKEALQLLDKFPLSHKVAVMGDMLELGSISDQAHKEVGGLVAKINPLYLITVGPGGNIIAAGAREAGFPAEKIRSFDFSDKAAPEVSSLIPEASVVLIKGSQGVRLEKITRELMADPARASELLCRQNGKWLLN